MSLYNLDFLLSHTTSEPMVERIEEVTVLMEGTIYDVPPQESSWEAGAVAMPKTSSYRQLTASLEDAANLLLEFDSSKPRESKAAVQLRSVTERSQLQYDTLMKLIGERVPAGYIPPTAEELKKAGGGKKMFTKDEDIALLYWLNHYEYPAAVLGKQPFYSWKEVAAHIGMLGQGIPPYKRVQSHVREFLQNGDKKPLSGEEKKFLKKLIKSYKDSKMPISWAEVDKKMQSQFKRLFGVARLSADARELLSQ